jgi:transcriptional regulator with XRE-family HTH domain
MNDFGRRLKLLREQKDLPMSKIAEDINITKSALSRYENGKMEPGLKVMKKVAEYFDTSLDWLAGYGDDEEYLHIEIHKDKERTETKVKRLNTYAEKITYRLDSEMIGIPKIAIK